MIMNYDDDDDNDDDDDAMSCLWSTCGQYHDDMILRLGHQ